MATTLDVRKRNGGWECRFEGAKIYTHVTEKMQEQTVNILNSF